MLELIMFVVTMVLLILIATTMFSKNRAVRHIALALLIRLVAIIFGLLLAGIFLLTVFSYC